MKPINFGREIIREYDTLLLQRRWLRLCVIVYFVLVAIAICGGLYSLHVVS